MHNLWNDFLFFLIDTITTIFVHSPTEHVILNGKLSAESIYSRMEFWLFFAMKRRKKSKAK